MNTAVASTCDVVNLPAEETGHRTSKAPRRPRADRVGRSGNDRGRERQSVPGRPFSLAVAARDYIWLYDVRHGMGDHDIAIRDRVSIRQVREGIERARQMERTLTRDHLMADLKSGRLGDMGLQLIPLFPVASFTPRSACAHSSPIRRGSSLCCMVCHASGMDEHPAMRREESAGSTSEAAPAKANGDTQLESSIGSPQTSNKRGRRLFAGTDATQPRS